MFLGLSGTRVTTFDLPEPGIAASRLCPGDVVWTTTILTLISVRGYPW
jgi:hypothetical protein